MDESEFASLCSNIDSLLEVFKQRTDEIADQRLVECCMRLTGFYRLLRNAVVAHGGKIAELHDVVGKHKERIKAIGQEIENEKKRTDASILRLEQRTMKIIEWCNTESDGVVRKFEDHKDAIDAVRRVVLYKVSGRAHDAIGGDERKPAAVDDTLRVGWSPSDDVDVVFNAASVLARVGVSPPRHTGRLLNTGLHTPSVAQAPVEAPRKKRKYELRSRESTSI